MQNRLIVIDIARSFALLCMVVFHFTWDLGMFGLIPPQTAFTGFFWYFARFTAGSFIFLAGLGLWLSHGAGIRWPAFWRRLAKIVAAAALVSIATRLAFPEAWIFYGILHSIAVSSLIGILLLRLPAAILLALTVFVLVLPWAWSHPAFGGWLIWSGLSGQTPITADYEPLFPWFAPFLAGMATGRIFTWLGLWPWLSRRETPFLRALAWPGKHSLAIYLIHQPLLIGALTSVLWLISRAG